MLETNGVPPSSTKPAVGQSAQAYHRAHRKRRLLTYVAIFTTILLLIVGGLVFKGWWVARHVLAQHSGVESQALKSPQIDESDLSNLTTEGSGRINILLLGVGDPGHAGSTLSDTMLIASIEPKSKQVALLSLPRDLYVPIPGYGTDKINAAHSLGENQKSGKGPDLAKQTVSDLLDVPIHNYVRVNFRAFKQGVTALGGVTVNVASSLYDSEYPCDKDERMACGFSLKAGTQVLNGDIALKYVRCRKGNCGNDFGRAMRQQQVLVAMRQKALTLSTLTNPAKLSGLIDTIGDNAKTDFSLTDLKNLTDIIKDIPESAIENKVLDNQTDGLVMTANIGGASVVIPKAGVGNFSDIRDLAHTLFADRHILEESARVIVHNASGKPALGASIVKMLQSYRYNVVMSDDVAVQPTTKLQDHAGEKTRYTRTYLAKRAGVQFEDSTSQPSDGDLVLTIGTDYKGAK